MSEQRRRLRVLIAVLAVIAGGLIGLAWSSSRLERSGRTSAENWVSQVLGSWSDEPLLAHSSSLFREAVDIDELQLGLAVMSRRLGAVQTCAEPEGALQRADGRLLTAHYDVECQFERGPATVQIALVRVGSDWQILGFTFRSPASGGAASPSGLQPFRPGRT